MPNIKIYSRSTSLYGSSEMGKNIDLSNNMEDYLEAIYVLDECRAPENKRACYKHQADE